MKRRLDRKTVENGGWAEGLGGRGWAEGTGWRGDGEGRRGEDTGGVIGTLKFALPWS